MEAKKAIPIFMLICVLIYFCDVTSAHANPNCRDCESTPKYIQVTFSNIALYSGRCETAGCGECSIITIDDPDNPINSTYILKRDAINPCQWSYADPRGPRSVRYEYGDYEYTDVTTGLKIKVTKGDYDSNSVSVSVVSKDEYLLSGWASYFWTVTDADDNCVEIISASNTTNECCCTLWLDYYPPYAPPWYAGLNGTVTIKELETIPIFGDFNDDGIVNFEDYAILTKAPLSYQTLKKFADNWLLETVPVDY